jgi:hypothetical protein
MENLTIALVFNCSRHLDINARTMVDINRDDLAMDEVAQVVLYPCKYTGLIHVHTYCYI